MDLVEKISRDYRIQSESARSFRVTLPTKFSRLTDVESGDKLGIEVGLDGNYGVIDLHQNPSDRMVTREVAGPNHLVRIPSALGCSMQIRREKYNWSLYKNEAGKFVYRVTTPFIPLIISEASWNFIKNAEVKPTKSDEHEHFALYIDNDMLDKLDWTENTDLGFLIAQKDDKVGLRCQPNNNDNSELFTTSVNKINNNKTQLRTYIPRALVRSCDLTNKTVEIYEKNNAIGIFAED